MGVSKNTNNYDNVHKPAHYTEGRKYEPKDVIRDWGLNFNTGNAVKYLARAGRKDDIVQDLRKAQEYIQFEIEAIEAERKKAVKPKAPTHSNCRCSTISFDELCKMEGIEDEAEVKCGVMETEIPEGTPSEEIISIITKMILGGE